MPRCRPTPTAFQKGEVFLYNGWNDKTEVEGGSNNYYSLDYGIQFFTFRSRLKFGNMDTQILVPCIIVENYITLVTS